MTFAFHDQAMWQARAADARLPKWLRVSSIAYATNRANGHAEFRQGELARTLGVPSQEASRAVRRAVELGWLSPGSGLRCLIMPLGVRYGPGKADAPCSHHHRDRQVLRQLSRQPTDWWVGRSVAGEATRSRSDLRRYNVPLGTRY